jgi:hypothetical protein
MLQRLELWPANARSVIQYRHIFSTQFQRRRHPANEKQNKGVVYRESPTPVATEERSKTPLQSVPPQDFPRCSNLNLITLQETHLNTQCYVSHSLRESERRHELKVQTLLTAHKYKR